MSIKFSSANGFNFDSGTSGKGLEIPQISSISSAPTTGVAEGTLLWDIASKQIYRFTGTIWEPGSGSAGTSGTSGSAGTSGTGGTSGTSGTSGSAGTSGTSGTSGSSGSAGTSGLLSLTGTTDNGVITLNGSAPNATVEANLTFDGTSLNLTGNYYINSAGPTGLNTGGSPYSILSINKTLGSAAYFDYRVSNTATGAYRSGTVMTVWDGTNSTYTDTSTPDLGASTNGIEFSTSVVGANIVLLGTITTGTWSVRIGARII